jgi:V/A-type H+/Na+-transporting ATPase subunit E
MQTKLQELTEKIYQEGVNKGREESDRMLEAAQKQAAEILAQANKQAETIVHDAEKQAVELKKNSLNELQLSARQLMSDTQNRLVNLIETKAIEPQVKAAFKDVEFTQEVVLTLVKNWNPKGTEAVDLKLLLPADKQKEFELFFKTKTTDLLKKGLDVTYTDKIKGGFKIGPKDGGYLISLSDEDFDNFFRAYMRPKLIEMLYKENA